MPDKTPDGAKTTVLEALKGLSPEDAASVIAEAVSVQSSLFKPYEALVFTRGVGGKVEKRTKDISAALIASVGTTPGAYTGFTVVSVDGRASVDTATLKEKYPDAYDEVVSWGNGYLTVRTTAKGI